jgi:hypothetical protein
MKSFFEGITILAIVVLAAAPLASCGGGGGGGSGIAPVVVTYEGLVSSVPAVNYVSDNLLVSSQVTAIRKYSGSGLIAQNTSLDTVASNHAHYLVINGLLSQPNYLTSLHNGIYGGHYEEPTLQLLGYTGASPQERATKAGYTGTVTELIIFGAATGTDCVNYLEDSVYHLIYLLSPIVDVGINFNPGNGSGSVCAIELGLSSNTKGQLPATGNQMFYPYNGQSGVQPTYNPQTEVPTPPSLTTSSQAGHPVVVSLYTLATPSLSGSDIVINTFSIKPASGVVSLPAQVLAYTGVNVTAFGQNGINDGNIPSAGIVALVPTSPLTPGTTYNVSFSANIQGQSSVNKTWSFTTGPQN